MMKPFKLTTTYTRMIEVTFEVKVLEENQSATLILALFEIISKKALTNINLNINYYAPIYTKPSRPLSCLAVIVSCLSR